MQGTEGVRIIYLRGSFDLLWSRMKARIDHFMKPQMLKSQFNTLEEPADALTVDVSMSVDEILQEVIKHIEQEL